MGPGTAEEAIATPSPSTPLPPPSPGKFSQVPLSRHAPPGMSAVSDRSTTRPSSRPPAYTPPCLFFLTHDERSHTRAMPASAMPARAPRTRPVMSYEQDAHRSAYHGRQTRRCSMPLYSAGAIRPLSLQHEQLSLREHPRTEEATSCRQGYILRHHDVDVRPFLDALYISLRRCALRT